MKKRLSLMLLCMMATFMAWAQTVVNGTVVSADDGLPVIGATVKVRGTNRGVLTDTEGKFMLDVEAGKQLIFSFMGMETVVRPAKNGMRVELQSTEEELDEVMVVAFGKQKRSQFTGSAVVLDSKDLAKHTVTNVADALVGNVAGLQMRGSSGQPGAGAGAISIRGINSMYAGTAPLIIVDGAPYPGNLSNISQDDIESVTVLKDAASAALYGARGANGVIIITTKKGKSVDAEITLDAKWGANSRAVQDYDVIKSPAEYYEAYYGSLYNKYFYNDGMSASAAWEMANSKMLSDLSYNAYSLPEGERLIGKNGKLNPNAILGNRYRGTDGQDYYITPDDWMSEGYRTGFRQQYDLSAKGLLSNNGDYLLSVGYLNDDGYIKHSNYERITARAKANYQVKKWLNVGANVAYTNSVHNGNPNLSQMLESSSYVAPIYPIYVRKYDADGKVVIAQDQYGHIMHDYGTGYYPGLNRPVQNTYNPFGTALYDFSKTKGNTLNATFNASVNFTRFLKFDATSTVTYITSDATQLQNSFEGAKASVNGELIKEKSNNLRTNNVQTLTYFDRFGKHDVNFMLGHEYYRMDYSWMQAIGRGLFSNDITEIDGCANHQVGARSNSDMYNVEGWFGNLYYNYDEKYFLSASYRRDASSRFAKDHRWGNFRSGGAAWLMNKENFLKDKAWIDNLKVKFSVGQQGNDGISNFLYADRYSLKRVSDTEMAPVFALKGNPEITWETTTNMNFGVEFSLKGRLAGNLDIYNKLTTDQLFWMSIPESMGSRGYWGNMGDVRNYGVELTLSGSPIRTKNLEWTIYGNIAHNKNRIVSLPTDKFVDPENGVNGWTEDSKWLEEGKSIYNAFYPKYAGVNEHGEALYWVDADLNGKTDRPGKKLSHTTTNYEEASFYEIGDQLPSVFGGFGTTLSAYGFDVSMTFDYQIGGLVHDYRYAALMGAPESAQTAGYNFHRDVLNAWSPGNTSANIPRFSYGDKYTTARSDRFLANASYLNFQSFSVGYTLPKKLTVKAGIDKVRVYCSGENLCFRSARQGLDPRGGFVETSRNNIYNPARTIMGGVQVTF